jgi:hypothetical protein
MEMDEAERLDTALETRPEVVGPDLAPLLDVAAEVARFLDGHWLAPSERHRIYARALETASRRARLAGVRRMLTDRRLPAIVGGAAVTVAAAAAIAVALSRERRPSTAAPAAA